MSSTPDAIRMVNDDFNRDDLARITADTFVDHIDFHAEIDSTNTRAAELATTASPLDRSTLLILAERQTSGRGRGANQWWSADGALTFSILLRNGVDQLPTHRWPLVSLTTGLAVCRAIEQLIESTGPSSPQSPAPSPQLKWPNDVYVAGRKICGILVEAATGRQGCVIIGIGLNVNNSVKDAPPELREKATALCDELPTQLRRADVLAAILTEFAAGLAQLVDGATNLLDEFDRRSLLTGRNVEVELATERISGICQGIDTDGALLVETPTGLKRILSGTVSRFG